MIHGRLESSFASFSFLLLIFFSLFLINLPIVNAVDFYITNPWEATKWKAGTTVSITWKLYTNTGPQINGINLDLLDGPDLSARVLQNIAFSLSTDATSFSWSILPETPSSSHVFIRITGTGADPIYRFSHRFEIYGGGEEWSSSSNITRFMDPSIATRAVSKSVNILPSITSFPQVISLWKDGDNDDSPITTTIEGINGSKGSGGALANGHDNLSSREKSQLSFMRKILTLSITLGITLAIMLI